MDRDPQDVSRSLTSPTQVGQTQHLTKLNGALVAACAWPALPLELRGRWASEVGAVRPEPLARYLDAAASPVLLRFACASDAVPPELQARARRRLAETRLTPDALDGLERHFARLLRQARSRLLNHLAVAERAEAERDRLDLLAEVVALRDAQAGVRGERSLARTFRAMFVTREPIAVWALACACLGAFVALRALDPTARGHLVEALRLDASPSAPWTVLTYAFVHHTDQWRHVILNVVALVAVGQVLELVLGHARFIGMFALLAIAAAGASLAYRALAGIPWPTLGASGAISGLGGMALILGVWFQRRYGRVPLRYATSTIVGGVILVSNILLSATAFDVGVDHGAHVGGLIAGVALAWWIRPTLAARADARFAAR